MMEVRREYKMTEIGEIPDKWEIKEIGDIFNTIANMSLSRNQTVKKGDSFYLHYGDIHKNKLSQFDTKRDLSWLPMINKNEVNIKENAKLITGDVVFADASEDLKDIGKNVVVVNEDNSEFYAGLHTIPLRESKEENKLDTFFKGYCFKNEQIKKQIRRLTNGATVFGISKPNLLSIKFAIPSLKEQKKIAEILFVVDEQIEQTNQIIGKTKELKKGLMQQLLTKGIGHAEFKQTELGYIPIDWKIKSLNEITTDVTIGLVTSMTKNYVDNGIPLIRNSDIKEGFVRTEKMVNLSYDFANSNKHKMLKRGDIVTIHTGDIGTSAVIEDNLIGALGFATLQTTVLDNTSSEWLMLFFNSEIAKKQFYNFSTGDGRNNLNLKEFVKTRIIVPNLLEEQNKISSIIYAVDEKIKGYENEKSKYEELKKGLMQQLLTGKTRVKVD